MKIASNKVVTIHYTLKDANGELIESSSGSEPMAYLHGVGSLVPGLENELEGKEKGAKISVVIPAEDAYGAHDPELIETVEKAEFDSTDDLAVGKEFQYDDEDGNVFHVRVTKIEGDEVTVDGNHPLAGQTLAFDVEVIDVRDATAEELEHGHVHGPHGHHH